jgi:dihydropteroate synthase
MIGIVNEKVWQCRERTVRFGAPFVMAILNLTPDSFYARSRIARVDEAVQRGIQAYHDGAQILDLGAESTRPSAEPLSPAEECERLIPVLQALRAELPEMFLSVDTRHTATAKVALEAGADIINDVSGCAPDAGLYELLAVSGAGYVLTHAKGGADYGDCLTDTATCTERVIQDLLLMARQAEAAGVKPEQIQFDPGLGFAKSAAVSTRLLQETARFAELPYSLMIAASRKRFLGALTHHDEAEDRGAASLGAALLALHAGANVVRMHDVRETIDALTVFSLLNANKDRRDV